MSNKVQKDLHKQDTANKKNIQKQKSAAEKRKNENEICTIMKKTKGVEGKRLAKKKKNENDICLSRAAKEYNIGYNNGYPQSEKSQKQTTEDKKKTDNKKSLCK